MGKHEDLGNFNMLNVVTTNCDGYKTESEHHKQQIFLGVSSMQSLVPTKMVKAVLVAYGGHTQNRACGFNVVVDHCVLVKLLI